MQVQTREANLMNDKIQHSGVIESIDEGCIHVRIVQTSACAACKVAGYCNAAEAKEKIVDVFCNTADTAWTIGQSVRVTAPAKVAPQALLLGFGIPFIVLVGVLMLVLWQTANEGLAALCGLGALLPYYGALFLWRNRLREKFVFSIESE